jgi:predicted esterase
MCGPVRTIAVETTTHGLALIRDAAAPSSSLLVGFHGYAQNAEDMLEELERVPGSERWTLVSVQGLHRFYRGGDGRVVASWMTRQDRELAIADNIAYVDRVVGTVLDGVTDARLVFLGFSQGVAMAYRAAVKGPRRARGIIAVGGDVPPDVQGVPAGRFPPVLIAAGERDEWYTAAKREADEAFLREHGVQHDVFRYPEGHAFTPGVRDRIRQALDALA